jgi:hypothetical protein
MSESKPAKPDPTKPAEEPAVPDLPEHGQPTPTEPAPAEPEAEPESKP